MRFTSPAIAEELSALEQGKIDPDSFPHIEHVRLAFEMLRRRPFAEAVMLFGSGTVDHRESREARDLQRDNDRGIPRLDW